MFVKKGANLQKQHPLWHRFIWLRLGIFSASMHWNSFATDAQLVFVLSFCSFVFFCFALAFLWSIALPQHQATRGLTTFWLILTMVETPRCSHSNVLLGNPNARPRSQEERCVFSFVMMSVACMENCGKAPSAEWACRSFFGEPPTPGGFFDGLL